MATVKVTVLRDSPTTPLLPLHMTLITNLTPEVLQTGPLSTAIRFGCFQRASDTEECLETKEHFRILVYATAIILFTRDLKLRAREMRQENCSKFH